MKYRIYRAKLPTHRERLQSGNKIGLTASAVMEELDIEATPARYEQVFTGQIMDEPGAMAAITDPAIRKKLQAGDILVLKAQTASGAWLIERLTKSQAQIQELPQFYSAVMGETFRKELEHPGPETKAMPLDTRESLNRMGATAIHSAPKNPGTIQGGGGGKCEFHIGPGTVNPESISKHGNGGRTRCELMQDTATASMIRPNPLKTWERIQQLMDDGKEYSVFLVNGYFLKKVKITRVGDGWMAVWHGDREQILMYSAISSIAEYRAKEDKNP